MDRLISFLLAWLGLSVLALGALGRRTLRVGGRTGLVLIAVAVLATRGAGPTRLIAAGSGPGLALGVGLVALPYAPSTVRRLPVVHRVAAVEDRLPLPWKPRLPAYVPAAALTETPPVPADAVPAPSPPADVTPVGLPGAARLDGVKHVWQSWNNCGPATITMALSYFGRQETQAAAMRFLKSNPDDKNVSPSELVAYAHWRGLEATWRIGGDQTRLKQLLANGVPVVVEVWIAPEPNDWMGHYRLLVGYDDAAGQFVAYDSVQPPGVNLPQPYARFDEDWHVFNRSYIAVYPSEQAALVEGIIGPNLDDTVMYQRALAAAQREAALRPDDGFAWFNVGSSLTGLGRTADAAAAFDRARSLQLPWRMLWYQFAPFEAYLAEGRYADVVALADANLQRSSDLEESHYYKGRALQAQGQTAAARAEYQAAVKWNAKYAAARQALAALG